MGVTRVKTLSARVVKLRVLKPEVVAVRVVRVNSVVRHIRDSEI